LRRWLVRGEMVVGIMGMMIPCERLSVAWIRRSELHDGYTLRQGFVTNFKSQELVFHEGRGEEQTEGLRRIEWASREQGV